MTDKYSVSIRRQGPAAAPFDIVAANGVSHGESADGTFAVVILGHETLSTPARAMAQRHAAGSFIDDALDAPGHDTVVIDRRRGTVTVLATPIGLSQVYWTSSSEHLWIASNPWQLRPAQAFDLMFQPERLFDYVYFHMVPSPHSVHHQLHRLSNGQRVLWTGPTCEVQRYWQPRFVDHEALPQPEARDELHRILRASIDAVLESRQDAGAFLSGGLDSSTVAGFAAAARPGIHTVTMGFDAAGYDEMEYARIASRHFKTTPLEYYVTPEDVLRTLPIIAAAFSEPFGNSSAAAAYHCARIAREHGIGLLLAGDGGDEIFGGNERYAKQLVFESYGRVPGAVRKGLVEPLVGTASKFTRAFPIGKAASYIAQANVPLPDRLQTYNFLHQHAPSEMFSPELLAKVDESAPMRALREEYGAPSASSPIDRMLFLDWKFTLHDNDLVKVNTMCELAGVQVAYPMLDHRLIDFSRRLSPSWKVRDGQLRWFYKRAMQGFLPDAIINKTKHGFGLPFGVWTRTHEGLQRLASDSLGSLAGRGFFKPEFLRTALRLHRDGHASYYGELVWILMVLELWLQAHYPNSRLE